MAVETEKEFKDWLTTQPREMCVLIAARAAVRVFPVPCCPHEISSETKQMALMTARAILTPTVAVAMATSSVNVANNAALAAAFATLDPPIRGTLPTDRAALAATDAATLASTDDPTENASLATSAVNRAANAAIDNLSYAVTGSDAFAAVTAAHQGASYTDTVFDFETLLQTPIWHSQNEPIWLSDGFLDRTYLLDSDPDWVFWLDWYQGWLTGKQVDWELQRRVALIEDAIWEAGPAAVAEEIERIREEFDRQEGSSEPRQPDFEPDSVERILTNKVIAATSTAYVSATIGEAIEAFHAETGWNEIPEPFVPLAQMPTSLQSIGAILKLREQSDETKQQLREEIGRLNAKVVKLEQELEALRSKGDPVFRDAVKKSFGDWKLYAALVTGVWFVSGDIEGMQTRLENIQSLRDEIFGVPPSPSPDIAPFDDSTVDV